jgi:DNA-binding NtrC family response regulator
VSETPKSVLLVVDDEQSVCRALKRMLQHRVANIITALTPAEAESVLQSGKVTHLICDHWFGPGEGLGLELVAKWRKKYHSVEQAVVLTGTDINSLTKPAGVDWVAPKTIDPDELVVLLGLSEAI